MTKSYPTALTDDQWHLLEPLLPQPKPGGRNHSVDLRQIVNALLYILMGEIPWRSLPHDFPKWQTVYWYFTQWRDDGTLEQINQTLFEYERTANHDRPPLLATWWWILSRWILPQ